MDSAMVPAQCRFLAVALSFLAGAVAGPQAALAEAREDSLSATREAARADLRAGRREVARVGFLRVLHSLPQDPEARFNLAGLALDRGDRGSALEHYRALLDHPQEGSEARYNIALVLTDQGHMEEAAREMTRVVQDRPDYAAARLRLAQLRERLGDPRDAATHYQQAAEIVPEDPAPLAGLARLATARDEVEEALELYRRAAALDPRDPTYPERAGDLEAGRGRRGPARIHWVAAEQALKGREGIDDRVSRARLAHKLGREADARALLRKALAQVPDHPAAQELAPQILGEQAARAVRAQGRAHAGLFETSRGTP